MKSHLYIVGAGPGDPELITLKAIKTLEKAEVVLYDALANEELLCYAPKDCLKIYVGKKAGMHSFQQGEINKMIVGYSKIFSRIVRLKGGDPYVFGRGHEELEYARSHEMEVTLIPGISSALAAPAMAGIPLTKRGVNESFWVVTGTLKDHSLAKDLSFAAQSSATVIILMGLKKLHKIVDLFTSFRGNREPIAIIQNGTRWDQRVLVADLKNILEKQKETQLASPAVLVIGKVVQESLQDVTRFIEAEGLVNEEGFY
jgi:uroporphyrin-III C-methyltransferase